METLLKDILYDEEKERIANKYRLAVIKIGDVVKHFKPKQKGLILDAFRDLLINCLKWILTEFKINM